MNQMGSYRKANSADLHARRCAPETPCRAVECLPPPEEKAIAFPNGADILSKRDQSSRTSSGDVRVARPGFSFAIRRGAGQRNLARTSSSRGRNYIGEESMAART